MKHLYGKCARKLARLVRADESRLALPRATREMGLSNASVLEVLIRDRAKAEGIEDPGEPESES